MKAKEYAGKRLAGERIARAVKRAAGRKKRPSAAELCRRKRIEMKQDGRITTRGGLLWRHGKVIHLPEADSVAIAHGYTCAERMVKALEEKQR